jgi:hypothetical protein
MSLGDHDRESPDAAAEDQALAVVQPRPDRMRLAASLAGASRNEFVYVGRAGEVRAPWRYELQSRVALGVAGTAGIAGTVLCFMIGAPWLSVAYLGALGYMGHAWRRSERLKSGAALLASDHLDEAEARLQPLTESKFTPRFVRALAWQNLGGVSARRGHHEQALTRVRTGRALMLGLRWAPVGPWPWISRFTETLLLAQLGRIEDARSVRRELDDAPDGEYFQILRMNTDLMIAFASADARALPTDLHPWTRIALQTTTAELALALLAWAHLARGDDDMGHHLLQEARERIEGPRFARTYPRVYAWMSRAAARA